MRKASKVLSILVFLMTMSFWICAKSDAAKVLGFLTFTASALWVTMAFDLDEKLNNKL